MIPALTTPHTVAVLLDEELISLNRAVGVLRRRNLPFESISVGPTDAPRVSRLTVMLCSDDATVERMVRQLEKTSGVRQAVQFRESDGIAREIALVKVRVRQERYAEFLDTVALFGASVVDEGEEEMIVEVVGAGAFVTALIRALEPFGVLETARSGAIALLRSTAAVAAAEPR